MNYLIIQSPEGYIDFEPAENEEWIAWMLEHRYKVIGTAQSDVGMRELEAGIARSVFQRI